MWYEWSGGSWKIADVIDFEWLVAEDTEVDHEAVRSPRRQLSEKISRPDEEAD